MADRRCHHCDTPAPDVDLRPYGPGGAFVCFPCATATPEREAQTAAAFGALLDAAQAASPSGVVAIGDQDGPRPFNPEEADCGLLLWMTGSPCGSEHGSTA